MSKYLLVLFFCFSSHAHGQVRNWDAIDEQNEWDRAKKLGIVAATLGQKIPNINCMRHDSMSVGDEGHLSGWAYEVFQIIDEKNMILTLNPKLPLLWVADYPTKGLADKTPVRLTGKLKAVEPKSYTTVLGVKKTVPAVRFMTEDEVRPKESPMPADSELLKNIKVKVKRYSIRTWKDVSGQFSIEAELVSFTPKDVTIKKKDGSEVKVPREKLSLDDLEYLKSGWKKDERIEELP